MNYTEWIFNRYPETKSWSSTETFKIIAVAKRKANFSCLAAIAPVYGLSVLSGYGAGIILNIEPFVGLRGWLLILTFLAIASIVGRWLVKSFTRFYINKQIVKT